MFFRNPAKFLAIGVRCKFFCLSFFPVYEFHISEKSFCTKIILFENNTEFSNCYLVFPCISVCLLSSALCVRTTPLKRTPPSSGQKPDEGGRHNKEMHHALLL